MNNELTIVMIMILISCVALIGAINSRGTGKLVVSYLLAFVCLALTAFNATQYFAQANQQKNQAMVQNMQQVMEQTAEAKIEAKAEAMALAQAEAQAEAEAAKDTEAENEYKSKAQSLAKKAYNLSVRLDGYKVVAATDEEYEELVKKANYYLGETRNYNQILQRLSVPSSLKASHKNLQAGVSLLASATSALRRYYKAEDQNEEKALEQTFRSQNSKAKNLLASAQSNLN